MPWRRIAATAAVLATAGLAAAPGAQATFHLIQVREVYPGSTASPNAEYVELQMFASGQNLVGGRKVTSFDAAGTNTGEVAFPGNVAGGANQSTVLMASAEAIAQFGVTPDATLPSTGLLDPAGGAVCWEALDCVSWGSYAGSATQPSPMGTPAAAIPDGMALRRGIGGGCATLLEPVDDHNNSVTDFAAAPPAPRPNSVAPTEAPCAVGAPPRPGEAAPQTTIGRKPAKRSHDRTATFSFRSTRPGSSFECALDRHRFRSCRSPLRTKPLRFGRHTFKVRARNAQGVADPSPAAYAFAVLRKPQAID